MNTVAVSTRPHVGEVSHCRSDCQGPFPSIHGYDIDAVIGEGGMGCVYRARQLSLDRIVALKAIRGQFAGKADFIHRLLMEARLLAKVGAHPNIAHVYDVLNEPTGHYIVMEYLEGESLQGLMERKVSFTSAEIARIGYSTAKALAAAHEQGVIHRDVKPANVMLCSDGLIKLMDFGVACAVDERGGGDNRHGVGTPQYMAPEVAEKCQTEDVRSDIYSLAVTLYVLVGRQYPFLPKKRRSQARSLRRQCPTFSAELETIIFRGFASEPMDRYATAHEFAAALRNVLHESREAVLVPLSRTLEEATPFSAAAEALTEPATLPLPSRREAALRENWRFTMMMFLMIVLMAAAGAWAVSKATSVEARTAAKVSMN